MRILVSLPEIRSAHDGPTVAAVETGRRLAAAGHSVIIISLARSRPQAVDTVRNAVQVRLVPSVGGRTRFATPGSLQRLLTDFRPDVLHIRESFNGLAVQLARLARRRRIPYVFEPHGTFEGYRHLPSRSRRLPYSAFAAWSKRTALFKAPAFIACGAIERAGMEGQGIPPDRIVVIPHGADDAFFAEEPPHRPGERVQALFVGNFGYTRKVEELVRAVDAANREGLPVDLSLVGAPVHQASFGGRKAMAVQGIGVHAKGILRGQALRDEFARADLFVYPSTYENFSLPIIEAAAAGLPILATRVGVVADIIEDGINGILLADTRSETILAGLRRAAQDLPRLTAEARARRGQLKDRFSWAVVTEETFQLYQRLTGAEAAHSGPKSRPRRSRAPGTRPTGPGTESAAQ